MDRDRLLAGAFELGISLTAVQLDRFEQFENALYEANEVMNLTRVPREECTVRHFLDCLILSPLLPEEVSLMDVGTGPGFPAWPLACARPDLHVTALDSGGKTHRFLNSQPLPNLLPCLGRAEEFGHSQKFDFVTGRAVAPLSAQLEISARLAKVGGTLVPMRSAGEKITGRESVFQRLGLKLMETKRVLVPGTDIERQIPVIKKCAETPANYPRRWADIKANPL